MELTYKENLNFDQLYEQVWVVSGDVKKLLSAKRLLSVLAFCGFACLISWSLDMLLLGAVCSAILLTVVLTKRQTVKKVLADLKKNSENVSNAQITVNDDGIMIQNDQSDHHLTWDSFESYFDTENACHVFTDEIHGIMIPYAGIKNQVEPAEFVEFIRSKVRNKFIRRNKRL